MNANLKSDKFLIFSHNPNLIYLESIRHLPAIFSMPEACFHSESKNVNKYRQLNLLSFYFNVNPKSWNPLLFRTKIQLQRLKGIRVNGSVMTNPGQSQVLKLTLSSSLQGAAFVTSLPQFDHPEFEEEDYFYEEYPDYEYYDKVN